MKSVGNSKSNRVMEAKLPTEWIRVSEVRTVGIERQRCQDETHIFPYKVSCAT